jgi:hypothetical protein
MCESQLTPDYMAHLNHLINPYYLNSIRQLHDRYTYRSIDRAPRILRTFPNLQTVTLHIRWDHLLDVASGGWNLNAYGPSTSIVSEPWMTAMQVMSERQPPLKRLTCSISGAEMMGHPDNTNSEYSRWYQPIKGQIQAQDDNAAEATGTNPQPWIYMGDLVMIHRHVPDNFDLHRKKMYIIQNKIREWGLFAGQKLAWRFEIGTAEIEPPRVRMELVVGEHRDGILCEIVGSLGNLSRIEPIESESEDWRRLIIGNVDIGF